MPHYRILFVCRANTCRSPMATGLARTRAREAGRAADFTFESAGVLPGDEGRPADPRAVTCARSRGFDLSGSRSRAVRSADFAAFDLLAALDHDVHARLVAMAPAGMAHKARPLLAFAPALGVDEVPDPWYGGPEDYDYALDLIGEAVDGLLDAMAA